jgi:hypothetical protein
MPAGAPLAERVVRAAFDLESAVRRRRPVRDGSAPYPEPVVI